MNRTELLLRGKAANGKIKIEDALAIAKETDRLLAEAIEMLETVRPQYGFIFGGKIEMFIGEVTDVKPLSAVYYHEKEPDGQ